MTRSNQTAPPDEPDTEDTDVDLAGDAPVDPPQRSVDEPAPGSSTGDYPDELVAAVRSAQLAICTQVVPEALDLRLKAAVAVPAGQWRRNAGANDPKVIALETPYRRTTPHQQ